MAKIDLKHLDFFVEDDFIKASIYDSCSEDGELIRIEGYDSDSLSKNFNVYLDKSTAIRFAKTLRTEINKIES